MAYKIAQKLRPCYANNKKALFHRWIDKDQYIVKFQANISYNSKEKIIDEFKATGILPNFCDTEMKTETFAIIEYEDGTVAEVRPTEMRFADNKISEYDF